MNGTESGTVEYRLEPGPPPKPVLNVYELQIEPGNFHKGRIPVFAEQLILFTKILPPGINFLHPGLECPFILRNKKRKRE